MFSQRLYKILEFLLKYTCLTGANGIQLNPKTASTFLTAKSKKRNNFGILSITILVVYFVTATTHIYFSKHKDKFPICYLFSLILIVVWVVVFPKFIQREELSELIAKLFAFTVRFQSKILIHIWLMAVYKIPSSILIVLQQKSG
jgi:hypothetical protein